MAGHSPASAAEKKRHVALVDRPHKGKSRMRRKKGKKDGRHDRSMTGIEARQRGSI